MTTSRTKACSTTDGFVQVLKIVKVSGTTETGYSYLDFKNIGGINSFNDQLCNAVSFLNYEILF